MYRRDYLMRTLRPLQQVIPTLLGLRKNGEYEEALAVIERTGQSLIGMDPGLMNRLSTASLLELMSVDALEGASKGLVLGTLFAEQGEVYEAIGNTDFAFGLYLKALEIYAHIMALHNLGSFTEYATALDELVDKLKGYVIPATVLYDLFDYYTEIGAYSRAEDRLFELIDPDEPDQAMVNDGILFYQLLLTKSDEELAAGNLPRAEVESGLQELLAMQ